MKEKEVSKEETKNKINLKYIKTLSRKQIFNVLSYLESIDIFHIMQVSKKFYEICQEEILWKSLCINILGKMDEKQENFKSNQKSTIDNEKISWKNYMKSYCDFKREGLNKRKRSLFGKLVVSEMYPNQIEEASFVLANAYMESPEFNYVFKNTTSKSKKLTLLNHVMYFLIKQTSIFGRGNIYNNYDSLGHHQI
jgi:hypothetical protein